ncbi:unnamed protein product, partial [Heterosigma akashiwo]
DLLDDSFKFVAPVVGPLNKEKFVKAFGSFNLRQAFPDLEDGCHDFRVDPTDPTRIWYTSKATGTHLGDLQFGDEVYPATGIQFQSPPETASMKWSSSNKCTELTAGYVMDKLDGNTQGLGGVFGILAAIGAPLPALLTTPPGRLLQQVFARSPRAVAYTPRTACALSPEAMFGLTREVLAQFPNVRPGLLAENFVFSSPAYPPLTKAEFLKRVPRDFEVLRGFPDYQANPSQLRVDPYDAARVFCVVTPTGTQTAPLPLGGGRTAEPSGNKLAGAPEAVGVIFNDDGKVVRLSYGYGMDRQLGNTGGLTGVAG